MVMDLLEIAQIELLSPQIGKVLEALHASSRELSENELRSKLSFSHNLAWRTLRKLSQLGWVTEKNGRYSISAKAMQFNPYDPNSSILMGKHGPRLIVAVNDFGPLSEKEASALIGVPRATVQRLAHKLLAAHILAESESGKLSLTGFLANGDPFALWPAVRDSLARFVAHIASLMKPIAIILYGTPKLSIMILYDSSTPQLGETLKEISIKAVSNEGLDVGTLAVASKHAWLRELHRVHVPPSIALRNALFGGAVFGQKPKHDFAYLYEAYNALNPISEDDRSVWLRKSWLVKTESSFAFTPAGLALIRKGPAKAIVQDSEVIQNIRTINIFA